MTAPRRRRWSDAAARGLRGSELKMPKLVDGQLTCDQLIQALHVLKTDGPEELMTFADVTEWLGLHIQTPKPPSPSTPPGTRGARSRRPYARPAGHPRRLQRSEARAAA